MLRQNPHNVHEWHKRVKLFEGRPESQIAEYAAAVGVVDPEKVRGLETVWPIKNHFLIACVFCFTSQSARISAPVRIHHMLPSLRPAC